MLFDQNSTSIYNIPETKFYFLDMLSDIYRYKNNYSYILFTCRAIAYQAPTIADVNVNVQLYKVARLVTFGEVQALPHSSTPYELLTKKKHS